MLIVESTFEPFDLGEEIDLLRILLFIERGYDKITAS